MRDLKKVLLTAGAVAAVGATASIGTFAGFTDSQALNGNTFTSGSVSVQLNDRARDNASSFINLADMVPGDSVAGVIKVKNNGTNRATYTLSSALGALSNSALAGRLTIALDGPTTEDYGPTALSTFATNDPVVPFELAPGASKSYGVTVSFPAGTDAADKLLESKSASIDFAVGAVQRSGALRDSGENATYQPDADSDPTP